MSKNNRPWWNLFGKDKEKGRKPDIGAMNRNNEQLKALEARKVSLEMLKSRDLSPMERFELLVKTYRGKNDVLIIPESMKDQMTVGDTIKRIYVNTTEPSIVRT